MDYLGDAAALAALYAGLAAPGTPAGLSPVREATANPPAAWGPLPAVAAVLDTSDLASGNGVRAGVSRYLVRFYLTEAADLTREAAALSAWATILVDVLKDHVQLDGRPNVARATVDGLKVDLLPYAGRLYAGIESKITLVTSEAWLATA
jgi:hypothetical protein